MGGWIRGGLDPWGVGSANIGRPIFAPNLPENACFKRDLGKFGGKNGAPQICTSNAPRIQPPT